MKRDFGLITGEHIPMAHQADDVERLSFHPRINIWNGLGTGKTDTAIWWLFMQWISGKIDEAILVAPGMCIKDWQNTMCGLALPEGIVDFYDCRPPNAEWIKEIVMSRSRSPQHRLTVMATTYGGIRSLIAEGSGTGRWKVDSKNPILVSARGRKIALVCDEAQSAALSGSAQGIGCRGMADACSAVASVTATPIGNPLSMRLWGMTKLVRPDVLMKHPPLSIHGKEVGKRGSFNAFKYRYSHMKDPLEGKRYPGGERRFSIHRAFPVSIHQDMIQREVLGPMAPFTTRRRKEDCLDLPDKVRLTRTFSLPKGAARILKSLIDDDRAVLENGRVIVPPNILVERLRTIELMGGWIEGDPVHTAKLALYRDVLAEIADNEGTRAPVCVWASRSRELLACALIAAGAKPADAQDLAGEAYPPGTSEVVSASYRRTVDRCRRAGVGIIHGPTRSQDRDRIQDEWKSGKMRTVCAHPGVAGAGLNWQHVKATIYYSQPLGTIARSQSEDRVHRHGLAHTALYFDLVMEGGPDEAVALAHRQQRNAADALLDWLLDRIME